MAQLLQLFTVDWDTTEDLGTSAATSLGLELDFIGSLSTRTVSWEGVSLCTHWHTQLSYCCIHWDRFMKACSYVLQCFSWWYTDVWDPIELQQSQGLLFHDPTSKTRTVLCHERLWFCTLIHTSVSYHCRHCTDLWDWIGSQGLLFRDPTSSLMLVLQDNWIPVRSWSCPCNWRCRLPLWAPIQTAQILTNSSETLGTQDSMTRGSWLCTLSLNLGRIIKVIRRWNVLQFTRSAQARCRSEVIAKCTKYKDNTQTKYIKVIRLWNKLQY